MRCKLTYLIVTNDTFNKLKEYELNEGYDQEIFLYSSNPQTGPALIENKINVPAGKVIIFPSSDKRARNKILEIAGVTGFESTYVNVE